MWMVVNAELLFDHLSLEVMLAYGEKKGKRKRRSHNGPFSYASYCRNILQSGEYCDTLTIGLIALMWQVRITTVGAPADVGASPPVQWRYHHNCSLKHVDLLLVYNGVNHYSAGGTYDGSYAL